MSDSSIPYKKRRTTHSVEIGNSQRKVIIGSNAPVLVQAMTNTDTADISSTVEQVVDLHEAGAELVRISVNNKPAARAVPVIVERLLQLNVPALLVGDFHYNGDQLLQEFPECAAGLAKYRINPGNVGKGEKKNRSFEAFISNAIVHNKPVRIGVNWGSLDQEMLGKKMDANARHPEPRPTWSVMRETLVTSALDSASLAESMGLPANRIIVSCKVSHVPELIAVYRSLGERCEYPLHLGLTEAGMHDKGVVASSAAIATLLAEGIGDTIRVSLTPTPGESRTREVRLAQEILQSLELRSFFPSVTACPGCGRTTSTFFQQLALSVEKHLQTNMPAWKQNHAGVEKMKVAVMGCVVNGPGESKQADIGISLPGTGEQPAAPVYANGRRITTLRGDNITGQFIGLIDEYVVNNYRRK